MRIELGGHTCMVIRDGGPKIYKDTAFYVAVKRALQAMGFDVIKKLMHKDGHGVSDHQYYIRQRRSDFCIHWTSDQIRPAYEDYNKNGEVMLTIAYMKDDIHDRVRVWGCLTIDAMLVKGGSCV